MKTIVLSDHTADEVERREEQRIDLEKSLWDAYQGRLAAYYQKKAETKIALRVAWDGLGISFPLIIALYGWFRARVADKPRTLTPVYTIPTDRENQWSAGNEGENIIHNFLYRQLGDDWTLIKGYHNPKGEIDFILVGPNGILAMEAKYLNGTISCVGDDWFLDKYDNYGNLVKCRQPIKDVGGRSPARQVNEPSDRLELFLKNRGIPRSLIRAVVLSHPKSRYGIFDNCSVNLVRLIGDFDPLEAAQFGGYQLSTPEVERIVDLIQRDHVYHKKQRQQRVPVSMAGKQRSSAQTHSEFGIVAGTRVM